MSPFFSFFLRSSFPRSLARRSGALLALFAGLFAAVPAFAAGEIAGTVAGYVYDPTGSALAEVPLTLKGSAMQQPMSRTSGEDGRFEFGQLPPGEDYVLEVEVPGFAPVKRAGISVRVGQTTAVDIKLAVLTETQAVATYEIVEKVNPVMNPDSAQSVAVVTAEKAAASPIFYQVEGVPQQVAGVGPGNRPSTRGGFSRYGKFYVDGMDTTDVTDGSITAPMNFLAVENFEIITGGMDAQYNALGMVENVVTKSGGNNFTYDVSAVLAPPFTSARNRFAANQPAYAGVLVNSNAELPDTSFYAPSVNLGGPIVKDRLWFFVSAETRRSLREAVVSTPYTSREVRPTNTRTDLARLKLTWQPTAKDRASVAFNYDRNLIENTLGNGSVTLDAEQKTDRGGYFVVGNYSHSFTDHLLFELQTGVTNKRVLFGPMNDTDEPSHVDSGSVVQFNAARVDRSDTEGNFLDESKQRFQFDPTLSWHLGPHQLKAGIQVAYLQSVQETGVTGGYRYFDGAGVCNPDDPSTFAFCSKRAEYFNTDGVAEPLRVRASVLSTGFFLQDRWTVSRKLTLVPGIRLDVGKLYGNGGAFITNLVGVGPRLSGTYDVSGDRKTLVTAHYGRSNDVGNIYIAQHANPTLTQVTSSFRSGAFVDCSPGSTADGCATSGGASGREFAAKQRAPYVDEVAVGLKREVAPLTALGVDLTYRHYGNNWVDEEVNRIYDPSGTRIVGYENGVAQSILLTRTAASAYRDYQGLDLWVQGTPGNWDLLASYTLAFVNGTVNDYFDGYLANPRMTKFFDGPVSDDRRHTLKGTMTYNTPFGLTLGVRMQYRTGSPLWMSFRNPADSSQRLYRSPRGTGFAVNNATGQPDFNDPSSWVELRNPSSLAVDLQARYDLGHALGLERTRLELAGLVVNALNSTDPFSLSDSWSTPNNRFGTVSTRQSPLQGELILRVRN